MKTAGVIGWPLTSSLSPIFQQAALDAAGVAAEFQSWPTAPADLAARLNAMRAAYCHGGSGEMNTARQANENGEAGQMETARQAK